MSEQHSLIVLDDGAVVVVGGADFESTLTTENELIGQRLCSRKSFPSWK